MQGTQLGKPPSRHCRGGLTAEPSSRRRQSRVIKQLSFPSVYDVSSSLFKQALPIGVEYFFISNFGISVVFFFFAEANDT